MFHAFAFGTERFFIQTSKPVQQMNEYHDRTIRRTKAITFEARNVPYPDRMRTIS